MRRIEKTVWILMVCSILGGFFAGYTTHQILTPEGMIKKMMMREGGRIYDASNTYP